MNITLYHNPKCSKSRETLAILQQYGANVHIVEYLNTPLNQEEIEFLIEKSGIPFELALRQDVPEYATFIQNQSLDKAQIIDLMVQYPRLLNRPFASGKKGVKFCRPPELVKDLL